MHFLGLIFIKNSAFELFCLSQHVYIHASQLYNRTLTHVDSTIYNAVYELGKNKIEKDLGNQREFGTSLKESLRGCLDCKEDWFCDDDVHDRYNNQNVEQVGTSWFIYNRKCQVLKEKKEMK